MILLLFGQPIEDQIQCVVEIIQRKKNCSMSMQEGNNEKNCMLFVKHVNRSTRLQFVHVFDYQETNNFIKYIEVHFTDRAPEIRSSNI